MSRSEAADILAQSSRRQARRRTIASDVRALGERLAGHSVADVQAIDAEEPSAHPGKHLMPRFGEKALADVTRQEIQAYVAHLTQAGYAPKSIDHMHDVLSAILRTAVKWGHLQEIRRAA